MDHKLLNNCPAQRTAQSAGVVHLGNPNNYVQMNIFPKQKLRSAVEVLPFASELFSLWLVWISQSLMMPCEERSNRSHTQNYRAHEASDTFLHLDLWLTKYLPSSCSLILEYLGPRCYRKTFCNLEHKCKDISLVCDPGATHTQI